MFSLIEIHNDLILRYTQHIKYPPIKNTVRRIKNLNTGSISEVFSLLSREVFAFEVETWGTGFSVGVGVGVGAEVGAEVGVGAGVSTGGKVEAGLEEVLPLLEPALGAPW